MALQTKVFTWGSYAYKSESNAYVLELTLTENSVDQGNNRSNISYKLVLKSGSNNRFDGQIDSVLKLAGVQAASGSKQIAAAYNASWTLLEGTTNVTHNQDGALNMPIEVSINTYNSYAPPDKTLSWSWALTTIPRASSITAVADVTLGNACSVQWTPNSSAFVYQLAFSIGGWSDRTGNISPKKTSAYTYNGYTIPLDGVAKQITGRNPGKMKVVLHTYSADGSLIGTSAAKEFTVTVPENEDTKPTVTLAVELEDAFEGLCLQGKTKLQGTLSASGKYGATIESLTLKVDGKSYGEPWLTKALTTTGQIPVAATAVDSRGFTGTYDTTVTVQPYYRPRLTGTAYRCTSDGVAKDDGQYLKIEATVDYASADGKNSASLWCRYRAENADSYSEKLRLVETLVPKVAVESDALLNDTLDKECGWSVQIIAVDAVGEETVLTAAIPSEAVYVHKPAGGNGMGLGGYCEGPGLTAHWDVNLKKNLSVDGELKVGDKLRVGGEGTAYFGGVYIGNVAVSGTNQLRIQTQIMITSASRQSIFLFGFDNYMLVQGVVGALNTGVATWNGTEGISVVMDKDGVVTITMPHTAYDRFVAISGDTFNFV